MNSQQAVSRARWALLPTLLVAASLSACNALDPYADSFERVAVGDSKSTVVSTMGAPSSSNTLQVPVVSLDSMTWRAPLNGKLYLVVVAMDRVVAKTAIQ